MDDKCSSLVIRVLVAEQTIMRQACRWLPGAAGTTEGRIWHEFATATRGTTKRGENENEMD